MLPGFVTRGPVVGEEKVAAFEARCGFPLPPDYRRFLLDQNGGDRPVAPEPDEDEDEDEAPEQTVRFFSLGAAAAVPVPVEEVNRDPERWHEEWLILMTDLELRMAGGRDHGSRSFPPDILPVAEPFVGVLLLRLKGRGTGAVFYCPHPEGYDPAGRLGKVAKSFAELVRDLDDYTWG